MVAQGGPVEPSGDATRGQIGLGRRARNRAGGMKETTRGFGGSRWRRRCAAAVRGRAGQGEKRMRLVHGLAKALQIAVEGDEIKEIAMLASGGIGPFAGGAGTVIRPLQTDIEAAAPRVHPVAGDPLTAPAAPLWEQMGAHRPHPR